QEVTAPQQRCQDPAEVLACKGLLDELDAVFLGFLPAPVGCRDDGDALRCNADMPQEQWQDTLPDTAKTDDEEPPWEIDIDLVIHDAPIVDLAEIAPSNFSGHRLRRPRAKSAVFARCAPPWLSAPPVRRVSAIVTGKGLHALHPTTERGIIDLPGQEPRGQLARLRTLERPPQQLKPGKDDHVYRGGNSSPDPVGPGQPRLE